MHYFNIILKDVLISWYLWQCLQNHFLVLMLPSIFRKYCCCINCVQSVIHDYNKYKSWNRLCVQDRHVCFQNFTTPIKHRDMHKTLLRHFKIWFFLHVWIMDCLPWKGLMLIIVSKYFSTLLLNKKKGKAIVGKTYAEYRNVWCITFHNVNRYQMEHSFYVPSSIIIFWKLKWTEKNIRIEYRELISICNVPPYLHMISAMSKKCHVETC